jgi:uncharacterized membrane protein HdeD (DUF308 family)
MQKEVGIKNVAHHHRSFSDFFRVSWLATQLVGIALICLGFLAIAFPFVSSLVTEIWMGIMFMVAGILTAIQAVAERHKKKFLPLLIVAVAYFLVGVVLLKMPLVGLITMTALVGSLLLIQGVTRLFFARHIGAHRGLTEFTLSGFLGLAIGLILLTGLPGAAFWTLGFLVGIDLILLGWATALHGWFQKAHTPNVEPPERASSL